ncbi:MAG: bifunctional diaminohydroxyphosphoribosylaminopyrimidine deaminase/5-amino-6-(5-phosphoribosylamino)uracil reductase RibD [Acidimicrobiales bacterium]
MSADAPEIATVTGDERAMVAAIAQAERARFWARPNPWVGAVVVSPSGATFTGFTEPPGRRHAERVALDAAGADAAGATVYVTLEPCAHHGRTPPCADALIDAGVDRVVIGVTDPDPHVAGQGIDRLRAAGIRVDVGPGHEAVSAQLAPYLHHRRTGRPLVVLKLAATMDGRTAAADGCSRWITGPEARADAHRLRAESDAILVGAGTVRADDPTLTVRDWAPADDVARPDGGFDPRRIVLGAVPEQAKVHPATEAGGELEELLDGWGSEGVLQLMVEGGAAVAGEFHRRGLVDRYVLYLAPALMGGDGGAPLLGGSGAATMADLWRGRILSVAAVGTDLRVELRPITPQEN